MTARARWCRAWLVALAAGALALLVWSLAPPAPEWRALESVEPQLAFWGFFVAVVSAIWKGVEVAGRITLQALAWSVKALWAFATKAYDAAKAVGKAFAFAGREIWQFLRTTLARAIVSGWRKLWHFVDRVRGWLERAFGPVLDFLLEIRRRILQFYEQWIRPVLDVIDIARKFARVLASLGVEWAKALDRKLAEIQEAIDRPFREVLGKLNEIITAVNRVMTADGLFQRLALIRSIERDIRYVSRAFVNWRSKPLTKAQWSAMRDRAGARTLEDVKRDTEEVIITGGGRYGPLVDEMVTQWSIYLRP